MENFDTQCTVLIIYTLYNGLSNHFLLAKPPSDYKEHLSSINEDLAM